MNNLNITKKRLTITFTLIVFIVVFLLWLIFFTTKYYNELRIEKNNFVNLIFSIKQRVNSIENFTKDLIYQKPIFPNISKNNKPIKWWIRSEFNIVIINKNDDSIFFANIKDNIDKLQNLIFDNKTYSLIENSWFLMSKFIHNENWIIYDIIFIKKLNYSFENFLNDIFSFLIIIILFSIWFYYIWYIFVNKALIPVENNIKDMKYFIQNAWHELKTPISVIDSNIQLIDDMKIYDKNLTREIKEEINRINTLMIWLLELTNINQNKILEEIQLEDFIQTVISWFKNQIIKKDLEIKVSIQKEVTLKVNRDHLYIFLTNIIWNAIKYNKKWWTIDILYKKWELIISDSWIWIKKEDLEKIFDRFYKADISRNSDWFGIWLSLVKKIADIYKWDIKVNSTFWEKTSFKIKI